MAMARSATYMRSKRRPFSASRIRWPRPERALIISVANMTMKERASATRMPAKMSGSAPGSTTRRKICACGTHVARRPDEDALRGAGTVEGIDERRIEAGERDDQDLGDVADAEPQQEHRQHHDLRHGVGEKDKGRQHFIEFFCNARREPEPHAEHGADDEARDRAHQARPCIGVELAGTERYDEVAADVERRQYVVRQPAQRRELPEDEQRDNEADPPQRWAMEAISTRNSGFTRSARMQ